MELLTPIKVGNITLKNRIMFPPLTTGYEGRDGSITEQSKAFYTRLAKGGVSYIVLGDVSPVASFSPTPRLFHDGQIAGFKDLADSVHAYGAKIGVQIFHPEYDVNALIELFQKKDMMGVRQKMHHDMEHYVTDVTEEQLMDIIQKMCDCAVRAEKAGIDFVQVHGDRLVGCLCSPLMNRRTDKFGGSFENRTRFAVMLVKALRQAVPNMGIDYKFSVITPERGKGGIPLAEAVDFAKLLEEAGVDMLHVAQANHTGNMADTIPPMGVQPYGFFVDIAGQVKQAVKVPVSCVGRIIDPEMAERALDSGKVAHSLHELSACAIAPKRIRTHLETITESVESIMALTDELERALNLSGSFEDLYQRAQHMAGDVSDAMNRLRARCDALETIVDQKDWPMPTYTDLLHRI